MVRKTDLVKELKVFIENLNRDFKISNFILFGSRATNKFKENSDVDLIIVSDNFKGMNFFERTSKMYAYWNLDLPVDFLCYTKDEFNILKKKISIVKESLNQGIIIQ